HGIAQWLDLDCPVLIEFRMCRFQPRSKRRHVSLCLPDRDTRSHAGNARHPVSLRFAVILSRVQADRLPKIDFTIEEIETLRQNTDYGARNRIHLHLAADDVGTAAEPALPKPVTDQQ